MIDSAIAGKLENEYSRLIRIPRGVDSPHCSKYQPSF
jgi:hypothetical protein